MCLNPNTFGFGLWASSSSPSRPARTARASFPARARALRSGLPGSPHRARRFARHGKSSSAGSSQPRRWLDPRHHPFDQPNVQRPRTGRTRFCRAMAGACPRVSPDETARASWLRLARAITSASRRSSIHRGNERRLDSLVSRARETGCVVTHGNGPRYLHSTASCTKGSADRVFLQSWTTGPEFRFRSQVWLGRLIRAQADGDIPP